MNMPFGQTMLTSEVEGPSNTASLTYGNGYDICGPLTYSVVNDIDVVVNESWLEFYFDTVQNQADILFFSLFSEPEGTVHTISLQVKAEMIDYPSARPAYIPFRLRYRGCFYDAFTASPVNP